MVKHCLQVCIATGKAKGPWVKKVLPKLGKPMPGVYIQARLADVANLTGDLGAVVDFYDCRAAKLLKHEASCRAPAAAAAAVLQASSRRAAGSAHLQCRWESLSKDLCYKIIQLAKDCGEAAASFLPSLGC